MNDANRTRVQARVTVPEPMCSSIDALRSRWSPTHSRGNPAHCTVLYHDETTWDASTVRRIEVAARGLTPFELKLGPAARFAEPDRGVYLTVEDHDRAIESLRARFFTAACTPRRRFGLHLTMVHPRDAGTIEEAWRALASVPPPGNFRVDRLEVVDASNATIAVVPIGGNRAPGGRA